MSKKVIVRPLGRKLLLDIPETKAGGIQVVQGAQIQEQGTIIDMGPGVPQRHPVQGTGRRDNPEGFEIGDVVQFKSWAIDIITIDGAKYYYLDSTSDAICGIKTS